MSCSVKTNARYDHNLAEMSTETPLTTYCFNDAAPLLTSRDEDLCFVMDQANQNIINILPGSRA